MGMFDEVTLRLKSLDLPEKGWQTKDFDCLLDRILITDDNPPIITRYYQEDQIILSNFSGVVSVYNSFSDGWYEFDLEYKKGKLINIEHVNFPKESGFYREPSLK